MEFNSNKPLKSVLIRISGSAYSFTLPPLNAYTPLKKTKSLFSCSIPHTFMYVQFFPQQYVQR